MMKKDVFYSKLKHWLESNGISAIKVIAPVKPLDMIHIDKSRIKSCDGFMFNGNKLFQDDIYILQCTKLKIGCLICKYRFFL